MILAAFPTTARLVVSGIGREFQPSMGEMLDAVSDAADNDGGDSNKGKCLILFPTEDAKTFDVIMEDVITKRDDAMHNTMDDQTTTRINNIDGDIDKGWDVIVMDGTWSQATKIHSKYLQESEGCLYRVQLSKEAVKALDHRSSPTDDGSADASDGNTAKGHQLRRHPIKVRIR